MFVIRQTGDHLDFDVDYGSGEITGADSERVKLIIQLSNGVASLPGNWPEMDAPDPLHNEASMALILAAEGYFLPQSMADLLPDLESDLPAGAIS